MITLIRDLGAGYLAGKLLVRDIDRNRAEREPTVTTVVNACGTSAMVIGTLVCANITGPIGLVVAGHDLYKHRDAIKTSIGKAAAKTLLAAEAAKSWVYKRLPTKKPRSAISNVTPITRKPRAKRVKGAQPC